MNTNFLVVSIFQNEIFSFENILVIFDILSNKFLAYCLARKIIVSLLQ